MVRSLLVGVLVFLAASCPLWCSAFEATLGACAWHGDHERPDHPDAPVPAPVNNDDCLCQGAVVPMESQSAALSAPHDSSPMDCLSAGGVSSSALRIGHVAFPTSHDGRLPGTAERLPALRC